MSDSNQADSGEASAPAAPHPSREERIRSAAYAAAERRAFAPGAETEDWLEAERQIDGESEEAAAPGSAP